MFIGASARAAVVDTVGSRLGLAPAVIKRTTLLLGTDGVDGQSVSDGLRRATVIAKQRSKTVEDLVDSCFHHVCELVYSRGL
jgi:hypothetical protein